VVAEESVKTDKALADRREDVLDKDAAAGPSEVVRYNGFPFETRMITQEDWRRVGVDHEDVSWDSSNNWSVDRATFSFLSDEQFKQYILLDGKFTIEKAA
jgi:hypothetical protein